MVTAQLRVEVPAWMWIGEVSRSHPETEFRLLTGIAVEEGAVELGEVRGGDVPAVVAAIVEHPAVTDHDMLLESEERALARVHTGEQNFYEFARAAALPPQFPLAVEDGWLRMEVTGTRDQLSRVRDALEHIGLDHELQALAPHSGATDLLTDRQREVLETALAAGFYEVPRRATLADVAAAVDVDTSTASEIVRRGEARLVAWHLLGESP